MSSNWRLNRRHLLYLGLSALGGVSALAIAKALKLHHRSQAFTSVEQDFVLSDQRPLKHRAAAKGLIYGADDGLGQLESDPEFAAILERECAMLIGGMLKWEFIRPAFDEFDFVKSDWYAQFAHDRGLLFRGHTLIWHLNLPSWFSETVNSANAEQVMINHINTVAGRYAGQMHSWDVVNEAVEPEDGRADNLRNSPWLQLLGPDYIDLAFRTAAEVDPQALLVYNDYGLEYDRGTDEAKRTAVLKLLESLKAKGTPIHALGIQSHLGGGATDFSPSKLQRFLANVADLGLKILITELDVVDQDLPADVSVRDRIVASVYEDYLSVVLNEPAVIAVITWGLSDRYTWVSDFYPRSDGAPVRPLPFDADFNPKLAWSAIARAFDQAPLKRQDL